MESFSPRARRNLEGLLLRAMADHHDPIMVECAQAVMGGHATLREVVSSAAYADYFGARMEESLQRWQEMSGEEREAVRAESAAMGRALEQMDPPPDW